MPFIYIVRHGETDANVKGQINDKNITIPLNNTGKDQATKTGKYLKKYRCKNNCVIYSSPSIRTTETAELIAKQLKINKDEINYDDRLIEIDHGLLSGSTKDDKIYKKYMKIKDKMPKDPIELVLKFPKFDKILEKEFRIENMEDTKKRVKKFFKSLPNKDVIIVTHSGIITVILMVLFDILPAHEIKGDLSNGKNCNITCILNEKNKYKLITLPNTKHLSLV